MKRKLLRNFRWRRDADKQGPREMAVIELLPRGSRVLSFSRCNNGLFCEAEPFVKIDDPETTNSELLRQVLSESSLHCPYVSIILNRGHGVVRLVNLKNEAAEGEAGEDIAEQIRESIGVEEGWQLAYDFISTETENNSEGEADQAVVTALPEDETNALYEVIEEAGFRPVSLTLSAATLVNMAESSKSLLRNDKAVGFLEISDNSSVLLLFINEKLVLVRQFRTGTQNFIKTIMDTYGLDSETAEKLLASGSFDFSGNLGDDLRSWLRQLGISLNFVERKYGSHVNKIYTLERMHGVQTLEGFLNDQLDAEVVSWDLSEAYSEIEESCLPDRNQYAGFSLAFCEGKRIMMEQEVNEDV